MKSRTFVKPDRQIVIIAHNIRSIQNVGSILRTANCLGIGKVYASGYTANLTTRTDGSNLPLLPHVKDKIIHELHRIALGAEKLVKLEYATNVFDLIESLKGQGFTIVGLEQADQAVSLQDYLPPSKLALLLGEEVHGLTPKLMVTCDTLLEIPMFGDKESYNVSVATGIALYQLVVAKG